ncbi:MAG: hypothetical protein V2A54_14145 [Bacteroidota bacterium]
MKKLKTTLGLLSILLISSCSQMYQVWDFSSSDVKESNSIWSFENSDISITYFLNNDGSLTFVLENKAKTPILIDWSKSHLILNGYSKDYWNDIETSKEFSISKGRASTLKDNNLISTYANQVTSKTGSTIREKKITHLPPNSRTTYTTSKIAYDVYSTCDFNFKGITGVKTQLLNFDKSTSPVIFSNYITYSVDQLNSSEKFVSNEFFASKLTNMKALAYKGVKVESTYCDPMGYKKKVSLWSYPYKKPNSLYQIVYVNKNSNSKK